MTNAGAKKRTDLFSLLRNNFLLRLAGIFLLVHICMPLKILHAQTIEEIKTVRIPTQQDIEKYRNDPAFNYKVAPQGDSLWTKLMRYLRNAFRIDEGSFADEFLTQYLWYILFVLLIGFLIYTIFRSDIKSIFYRSSSSKMQMQVLEEDINEIDFIKMISDAVNSSNYRYAIRLYYLKNLKELNDKGLIIWKSNKTNQDYLQELSGKNIHNNFASITRLFNWIWYGDFPLSEQDFSEMKSEFVQFSSQINTNS